MPAAVVNDMSRDLTVFQFDVDESAVRRALALIPGVTPLEPTDESTPDESGAPDAGEPTRRSDDATAGRSTDDEFRGAPERAGAEAHLSGGVGPGAGRAGAKRMTGPSTPWPGAPGAGAEEDADGGLLDRLRERRALLIGGAVAVVGAVGAAAVWYLKFRGSDDADRDAVRGSGVGDQAGETRETAGTSTGRGREPPADDEDSRSYPVDVAPVVGMAFLALATVLLRRVGGRDDDR